MRRRVELAGRRRRARPRVRRHRELPDVARPDGTTTARRSSRVDLDTGVPKWSFQPRGPSNNDFDFAGAPNLFEANGQALVGLGGKDGVYYALDRVTGKLVWKRAGRRGQACVAELLDRRFIGATAVADGLVVGGTAIGGPCPCLHGIDASHRRDRVAAERGRADVRRDRASSNGVAFSGSTTDFTLARRRPAHRQGALVAGARGRHRGRRRGERRHRRRGRRDPRARRRGRPAPNSGVYGVHARRRRRRRSRRSRAGDTLPPTPGRAAADRARPERAGRRRAASRSRARSTSRSRRRRRERARR